MDLRVDSPKDDKNSACSLFCINLYLIVLFLKKPNVIRLKCVLLHLLLKYNVQARPTRGRHRKWKKKTPYYTSQNII